MGQVFFVAIYVEEGKMTLTGKYFDRIINDDYKIIYIAVGFQLSHVVWERHPPWNTIFGTRIFLLLAKIWSTSQIRPIQSSVSLELLQISSYVLSIFTYNLLILLSCWYEFYVSDLIDTTCTWEESYYYVYVRISHLLSPSLFGPPRLYVQAAASNELHPKDMVATQPCQ